MKEIYRGIAALAAAFWLVQTTAADFSVKTGEESAPAKIAEPVRGLLSSKPVQLLEGDKPVMQIWFRNDLPLKAKPAGPSKSLDAIAETTLVGVVAIEQTGIKDYKDNDIPKGVYTARFVMQPQDGDHLGTAEFNTFIALLPSDVDKAPETFTKYTPMVKASGKLTSSGHPAIISLRPVSSSAEGSFPALVEPAAEHKAIRLKVAGKAGTEAVDLVFDLVFQGHGHIQ